MLVKEVINDILTKGYLGDNIFMRVTGDTDNYLLLIGFKRNNRFYYSASRYSAKQNVLHEVRRLVSIYIPTSTKRRVRELCFYR